MNGRKMSQMSTFVHILCSSIAIIEEHGFNSHSLAIKMLEMGLDKNIGYVTIEPIDE